MLCVCTYHQNVKLMLSDLSLNRTYLDLIYMVVCDQNSNICMVHRCPGIVKVEKHLKEHFQLPDEI